MGGTSKMTKEVPRKVIVVVLIFALVISSYITLMSLRNKADAVEQKSGGTTVQSAEITLNVLPPEPTSEEEGTGDGAG